jgi:hypothetical protein
MQKLDVSKIEDIKKVNIVFGIVWLLTFCYCLHSEYLMQMEATNWQVFFWIEVGLVIGEITALNVASLKLEKPCIYANKNTTFFDKTSSFWNAMMVIMILIAREIVRWIV